MVCTRLTSLTALRTPIDIKYLVAIHVEEVTTRNKKMRLLVSVLMLVGLYSAPALSKLFADQFTAYKARVRRWL